MWACQKYATRNPAIFRLIYLFSHSVRISYSYCPRGITCICNHMFSLEARELVDWYFRGLMCLGKRSRSSEVVYLCSDVYHAQPGEDCDIFLTFCSHRASTSFVYFPLLVLWAFSLPSRFRHAGLHPWFIACRCSFRRHSAPWVLTLQIKCKLWMLVGLFQILTLVCTKRKSLAQEAHVHQKRQGLPLKLSL